MAAPRTNDRDNLDNLIDALVYPVLCYFDEILDNCCGDESKRVIEFGSQLRQIKEGDGVEHVCVALKRLCPNLDYICRLLIYLHAQHTFSMLPSAGGDLDEDVTDDEVNRFMRCLIDGCAMHVYRSAFDFVTVRQARTKGDKVWQLCASAIQNALFAVTYALEQVGNKRRKVDVPADEVRNIEVESDAVENEQWAGVIDEQVPQPEPLDSVAAPETEPEMDLDPNPKPELDRDPSAELDRDPSAELDNVYEVQTVPMGFDNPNVKLVDMEGSPDGDEAEIMTVAKAIDRVMEQVATNSVMDVAPPRPLFNVGRDAPDL